jgi:hypothetical protein
MGNSSSKQPTSKSLGLLADDDHHDGGGYGSHDGGANTGTAAYGGVINFGGFGGNAGNQINASVS